MYSFKRPVKLEINALNYVFETQIKYRNNDGKFYPIAFYFYKLIKAKLNYFIYNKEFFVIINAFKNKKNLSGLNRSS